MIFATGFAPFRGGPMHYARTRGFADVRDTLKRFAARVWAALPARSGLGLVCNDPFGRAGGARRCSTIRRGLPTPSSRKSARRSCSRCHSALARPTTSPMRCTPRPRIDPSIRLTIFTALTLTPPHAKSELEHRFLDPIAQRVFAGYPALDYATAIRAGKVPPNIEINEFFFEAGQWLNSPYAQQQYISANYTQALQCVLDRGVNVVGQLVAHRAEESPDPYSLSCNPDLTIDLLTLRHQRRVDFLFVGQVNSELPFMPGDAAIAAGEFDLLLDSPATDFPLFAPPREPVSLADYAAGLHAASLVPDGGTLQIGIGSHWARRWRRPWSCGSVTMPSSADLLTRLGYDPARDEAVHDRAVCDRTLRLHGIVRRGTARSVSRRHPQARGERGRAARRLLHRVARVLSEPARDAARGRAEIRHDVDLLRQRALRRRSQEAPRAAPMRVFSTTR